MSVYYNEFDPFAAAWLRELMKDGQIPEGVVDERSITEVTPDDVRGFTQCHFFAGIGGWAYALNLAGWGAEPVWSGSCPCQPFSAAGKGGGTDDKRHLWPEFARLIRECLPSTIFGEQVGSPLGLAWLDAVSADLEAAGYAVGAIDLGAAGVGAPHLRQRLWFVANAESANGQVSVCERGSQQAMPESGRASGLGELGHADDAGSQGRCERRDGADQCVAWPPSVAVEWIPCRDGKWRPTQPGLFPLAHGVPNRVGTLRGAGNAIVPQVAAEVVKAYLETR